MQGDGRHFRLKYNNIIIMIIILLILNLFLFSPVIFLFSNSFFSFLVLSLPSTIFVVKAQNHKWNGFNLSIAACSLKI